MVDLSKTRACGNKAHRELLPADPHDEKHAGFYAMKRGKDGRRTVVTRWCSWCKDCMREQARVRAGIKARGVPYEARPKMTPRERATYRQRCYRRKQKRLAELQEHQRRMRQARTAEAEKYRERERIERRKRRRRAAAAKRRREKERKATARAQLRAERAAGRALEEQAKAERRAAREAARVERQERLAREAEERAARYVSPEPLRAWLEESLEVYGTKVALAAALGIHEDRLRHIMRGYSLKNGKRYQHKRYTLEFVDRILIHEGSTSVAELWP
jgi:hypothetical protein